MPKNPWPRYLLILAASALAFTGAMAALNYAADPYGVWHYGQPGDWTKSRPRIRDVERLHQAHAVRDAQADALLLGNSRVITGLDPRHPALPAGTYNLGLSACDIYECQRYLQHAVHLHKPKLVLFAIDKGMFDAEGKPAVDFSEARLSVDAAMHPQPHWRRADFSDTIFSLTAVGDSLRTLTARGGAPVIYARGMRDEVLMKPYLKTANILVENEHWKTAARKFALTDGTGANAQFTALRAVLRLCAAEGIDLILFTNPVHAELLEIEYGDGKDFAAWLRQVTAIIVEETAAGGGKVPFWNFYGYNAITTEPFPDRNQPVSKMENYWEISHYRKAVGNLVLDRVLGRSAPRLEAVPEFGTLVSAQTVEADLQRLARERAGWQGRRTAPPSP